VPDKDPLAPRRAALLVGLTMAVVYGLTAKGYVEVTDTEYSIRTARALVERRAWDIELPSGWTGFHTPSGKVYSKYGPGLPLVFVPLVLLSKGLVAVTGLPEDRITGFVVSFYNVPFGATTCGLLVLYACRLGAGVRAAQAVGFLLGVATLMWRYSVYDFSEVLQAFLLMLSVVLLGRRSDRALVAGSLALGSLVLVKAVYLAYVPLLVFYAADPFVERKGSARRAVLALSGVAAALAFLLWLNYARFGDVFETGYGQEAREWHPKDVPERALALLISPDKGLFLFAPVVVLGLLGALRLRHAALRSEIQLLAGVVCLNLLLAAGWHSWQGGWSWGPRLLIPAVPFWLAPSFLALPRTAAWAPRLALGTLVASSIAIQLMSVLQRDQEYHHIRLVMLPPETRVHLPGDLRGSWICFRNKLAGRGNRYPLRDFGIDADGIVDTSQWQSFRGFNVWPYHLWRALATEP
jgi:hypothetical protein